MKIGVTGASGLIGTALTPALERDGHEVVRFVRGQAAGPGERAWDPDSRHLEPTAVADLDAVVHLAGAGVADKRWTDERKKLVLDSRVDSTTALTQAIAAARSADLPEGKGPDVLLSASAIGFYGDGGDRLLDETAPSGDGFLAEVCRAWEDATAPAEAAGVRVAHLRTGIVLSDKGGILKRTLPIYKLGLGAPLGSGEQWMSWISLRDEVAAIVHCLTHEVSGPVNLVGPAPVTNRDYTKTLNHVLHRPTIPIGVPGLVLKLAVGQFAEEGILAGQRLAPTVLQGSGFAFQDSTLESALRQLL